MTKKPNYEELEQRVRGLENEALERKRAEEALRESEKRLNAILDATTETMLLLDREGMVYAANQIVCDRLGTTKEEFIGKRIYDFFPPNVAERRKKKFSEVFNTGKPVIFEDIREGMTFEQSVYPISDDTNQVIMVAVFANDITERKRAEVALLESEEKYRSLANNLNTGIYRNSVGPEGQFIEANPAIVKMFGFHSKQEFLESKVSDLYKNSEDRIAYNEKLLRNSQVKNEELQLRKKDGAVIIGSVSAVVVKGENGDVRYFDGIIEDITERKHAEVALSESGAKFRSIFENKGTATGIFGDDGIIRECNAVFEELSGYSKSEIIDVMKWSDFVVKEDIERLQKYHAERLKNGDPPPLQYECGIINKKGETVTVIVNINLFGKDRIVSLTDITARKQAEDERERLKTQLQQAQKMEAIGTLAGGIAHDFNNILGIILGNAELAMDDVPEWNPARGNLDEVRKACMRAKDVVRQILSFSRKSKSEQKPMNIASVVTESLKLLRASIPTSINIHQNISTDIDHIHGDPTQIHQIMINLCTNAAHAMEDAGGTLEVVLENTELDEDTAYRHPELKPGPYVQLSVSDTGFGMSPEVIDRIFDPYFTTKDVGKGTGLGLSVVHGIVNSHKGRISVESEVGKGTTFNILFPAVERQIPQKPKKLEELPTGEERILFVDDEDAMVSLNRQRLERLGYTVVSKTDPTEALAFFRYNPEQIDLIITDMTMPKMTGDRLAQEILKIRSDIPIILCTGYSQKMSEDKAQELGIKKYIEKPIKMENLARSVREVLDGQ